MVYVYCIVQFRKAHENCEIFWDSRQAAQGISLFYFQLIVQKYIIAGGDLGVRLNVVWVCG